MGKRNMQKRAGLRNGSGDNEKRIKAGAKVYGLSSWGDGSPFTDRGRNWRRA